MKLLNLIKKNIYLMLILLIATYLRFDRVGEFMQFIPDQGWFYLSARDMILTGEIPLVGPPTSHPWIHHGALWTYVLGIILWIFMFDPVVPAYFIAALGVATVPLFYLIVRLIFNEKIALLASILYAASPLMVMNARIPYHTSPIPFYVILLFFATYKWIKGNVWFFPMIAFLLGVLYNHEITTFVFFIAITIIAGYGFIKKEAWFKKLFDKKLILVSAISFLIPMIPFILYDISHGWRQTLGFLVWVIYRIVKFPLSLINQNFVSPGSSPSTLPEFFSYYRQLIYVQSDAIVLIILFATAIFVIQYLIHVIQFKKNLPIHFRKKIPLSYLLLFLFLSVSLPGLSVHRVPIEADTLLISPFIIILTAISLLWIARNKFILALVLVIIISVSNTLSLLSTNFLTKSPGTRIAFCERLEAVEKVIFISGGKPYNVVGQGDLSNFPVFTMPYEYLLWWKGHAPQDESVPFKIVIWEKGNEIIVYEKK